MTEKSTFVDDMTASIATWHGVAPPNPAALRMLARLEKLIGDFQALRGTLRFEDEPSSFEAAPRETALIRGPASRPSGPMSLTPHRSKRPARCAAATCAR